MHLADIGSLQPEEIQLLANSTEPIFVLELPPGAKALIQHNLLSAFPAICLHTERPCLVLSTTEKGGAYVAAWLDDMTNPRDCESYLQRPNQEQTSSLVDMWKL